LLKTEETYVSRLKIIAEDFRKMILDVNAKAGKPILSDTNISIIFLNINEIYNLNKQLLKDLKDRMDIWSDNEQISDVMISFAPFLKLYSMYTAGFEDSIKNLTEMMSREKKLDGAVKEFEKSLGTGLGIIDYMLEPVQRIPRYKLLLAGDCDHMILSHDRLTLL
jgi:FYVE/RhoGEF/PH domain-containing protein 5/6